jgi:hypothetical protein
MGGFEVVLKEDLTWSSIAGSGEGNFIWGRWNLFGDSSDLHTGIKSTGCRFWLQYRLFGCMGGVKSHGLPGLQEFTYLGHVYGSFLFSSSELQTVTNALIKCTELIDRFIQGNPKRLFHAEAPPPPALNR